MLGYLSTDIICSEKLNIKSVDKYPSILSRQMRAIVFIILQTFFVTRPVLKIGEHHSDIPQAWEYSVPWTVIF